MKTKITNRLVAVILSLVMILGATTMLTACKSETSTGATESATTATVDELALVWEDAKYKADTALGAGEHNFTFCVKVGDNSVTFAINTDETTVGTALLNLGLVAGDVGDYGLYVKTVNGMLADYDVNMCYWSFYENGELAMNGVDKTEVKDGANYEMVYTK